MHSLNRLEPYYDVYPKLIFKPLLVERPAAGRPAVWELLQVLSGRPPAGRLRKRWLQKKIEKLKITRRMSKMWKVSRNLVLEHIYTFPEPFGTLLWRIPEANFQTFIRPLAGRRPAVWEKVVQRRSKIKSKKSSKCIYIVFCGVISTKQLKYSYFPVLD